MKKLLIIVTALALATGAARAANSEGHVTATCGLWGCVFEQLPSGDTRIIRVPGGLQDDPDPRWLAFCKPHFVSDSLGVERAVYAHPGCDVGRYR